MVLHQHESDRSSEYDSIFTFSWVDDHNFHVKELLPLFVKPFIRVNGLKDPRVKNDILNL